jgi:tetratricopeptide (TPR) repeat protein
MRNAIESELATALAALQRDDLAAAEALTQRLLQEGPDEPAFHQLAAALALKRGHFDDARRAAAASLSRRPDHVPTLLLAGRAARAAKDPARALAFFRRAAELALDQAEPAFLTCATLLEQGDAAAATLLPQLLERFPDDADGWGLLGDVLQSAAKPEAALIAFTRAAQAKPSCALQLRRGALLESLGRTAEAGDAYRAAMTVPPESADVALQVGYCLRRVRDFNNAAAALERGLSLAPADANAWFAFGLVRQDQRALAAAIDAYTRALELRPDFVEAAVNLGICHQEAGDIDAAKLAYGAALAMRPDTFGRIAQALSSSPVGEVWLDAAALRRSLAE